MKQIRQENNTRRMSFVSPQDLAEKFGLTPGSVTPLGFLNDQEHEVHFYLDSYFLAQPLIAVHPNANTATVWLAPNDLLKITKNLGNSFKIVQM